MPTPIKDYERQEISWHECLVYCNLSPDKWLSTKEIAFACNLSIRTVNFHLKRFTGLGLIDLAEVFPSHRYRLSRKAERRNKSYFERLKFAIEVFGLNEKDAIAKNPSKTSVETPVR